MSKRDELFYESMFNDCFWNINFILIYEISQGSKGDWKNHDKYLRWNE